MSTGTPDRGEGGDWKGQRTGQVALKEGKQGGDRGSVLTGERSALEGSPRGSRVEGVRVFVRKVDTVLRKTLSLSLNLYRLFVFLMKERYVPNLLMILIDFLFINYVFSLLTVLGIH